MNRDESTKRLIEYIKRETPALNEIKRAKKVFNIYYGSVNVFRSANASRLYNLYKPRCVLDFTMGWGGRLVGACCSKVPQYIGVDNNTRLIEPYDKMCAQLKEMNVVTAVTLLFKDCNMVDYSQYKYDMVFTSPPYYNKEIYGGANTMTVEEWDNTFYKPIFKNTWEHMEVGGRYCLNVPVMLYEKICVPIFGEAGEKIELNKFSRTVPKREVVRKNLGQKYKEYIYIWVKHN